MKGKTLSYKGKQFDIVMDDKINPAKHCDYCDFYDLCESYIEENGWFPCGATFSATKIYLKENK